MNLITLMRDNPDKTVWELVNLGMQGDDRKLHSRRMGALQADKDIQALMTAHDEEVRRRQLARYNNIVNAEQMV
jgi:hypothetical protein